MADAIYTRPVNEACRPWSGAELEYLRANYAIYGAAYCALRLNRSKNACHMKACYLNLTRTHGHKIPEERERIVASPTHSAVRESSFIRPISLSRLMGGR